MMAALITITLHHIEVVRCHLSGRCIGYHNVPDTQTLQARWTQVEAMADDIHRMGCPACREERGQR